MKTPHARCSAFPPRSTVAWTVFALMISVACPAAPPPQVGEASATEVEAALKGFAAAWEREDVEAAAGTFTRDAIVFDPVPPGKFENAEGIRAWISGSFDTLEGISISLSQLRVQTAGQVAWCTAHFLFTAQQGGMPLRAEGYVSTVWVRQADGSPKLSVFHASHLPAPTGS